MNAVVYGIGIGAIAVVMIYCIVRFARTVDTRLEMKKKRELDREANFIRLCGELAEIKTSQREGNELLSDIKSVLCDMQSDGISPMLDNSRKSTATVEKIWAQFHVMGNVLGIDPKKDYPRYIDENDVEESQDVINEMIAEEMKNQGLSYREAANVVKSRMAHRNAVNGR